MVEGKNEMVAPLQGVGHGHVHHSIFVKIFHVNPFVAVQKIRQWGSMGIGRDFSSTFKMRWFSLGKTVLLRRNLFITITA